MIRYLLVGLRSVSALVCCSFLWTVLSFAQGYFGTVSGVVTDPSGAAIPNAKVTLIDQEKGFTFDGKSDNSGRYIFRDVPPGAYKVLAEAPGFSRQEKTNIRVDVSTNPSANLRLKIGSTTTVVVSADDQHLDTDDATGATVVNRNLIDNLPLIDRSVMELAYLAPGTTNVNPSSLVLPTPYTLGNAPRSDASIRDPGSFQVNASVNKVFVLREGVTMELRLEANNAFNHPVFGTPDQSIDDPNFGVISYTSNKARQVQLAAKVNF